MAQLAVAGPLGERDLRDEPRPHPVHAAPRQPVGLEWRRALLQASEPPMEPREYLVAEAGSDLARELELAARVVPEQKRAESDADALGVAIATDDEFLRVRALELQPVGRAPVHVLGVGALGDQSLQAFAACCREELLAVRRAMGQEAQRRAIAQRGAQQPLALDERQARRLVPV